MRRNQLGHVFHDRERREGIASILARGFMPQLWKDPDLRPADYFSSYQATYLERDVRQLLNVSSLRDFDRFMRACAVRSGQLLNKTELAKEVGISNKTATEWLGVLEASNQITLLEPWFTNVGKRLTKTPKLYFNDVGLLCFLLGLNQASVSDSYLIGSIWETFLFAELRKYLSATAPEARFPTLEAVLGSLGLRLSVEVIADGKVQPGRAGAAPRNGVNGVNCQRRQ